MTETTGYVNLTTLFPLKKKKDVHVLFTSHSIMKILEYNMYIFQWNE